MAKTTENTSSKLQVKCFSEEHGLKHPSCAHGPCLLFFESDENDGYYACAAYRNKRDCNFHLPVKLLKEKQLHRCYELPTEAYRLMRQKVLSSCNENGDIYYCHNCNAVLLLEELKAHKDAHDLVKLTVDKNSRLLKNDPTTILKPMQNDKAQAQYFFDNKALNFFEKCFSDLGITKVVCIGAPRLHGYLLKEGDKLHIQSYLLDFDHRFYYFYDDTHFAWYNMCNNHFFDERQKQMFLRFLKSNGVERILLFTDPPFGCRTEPIAHTLRQLTNLYNSINNRLHQPLSIFWIFPYFSSTYIQNEMPELEMCDYKVNYTNHIVYSDNGAKENRKLGSPVRVFTNVPLELLKLPVEEGYKYCRSCWRYTALENRHCKVCGICPSKNGSAYRHCTLCGVCVKPNYVHCPNCRRCTQIEGHNCKEYQCKQRCWICLQVGHIETECEAWRKTSKHFIFTAPKMGDGKQICCLLCGKLGHNERACLMRYKYVEETTFLGKTVISFR